MAQHQVTDIEVVQDFTATARCDEGFLHVRRLSCRNVRADGTTSSIYRVDVVDRPRLDAVASVVWRRTEGGIEVLTRRQLRPAAYFRREKSPALSDGQSHLWVEEIVAGLLEPTDRGLEGLRHRAAEEVREEAGFSVSPEQVQLLGGPFFLAPGILSEKIFLTAVEVTGRPQMEAAGDGTPLEEGAHTRWWPLARLSEACEQGDIQDAKTEIGVTRLKSLLRGGQ